MLTGGRNRLVSRGYKEKVAGTSRTEIEQRGMRTEDVSDLLLLHPGLSRLSSMLSRLGVQDDLLVALAAPSLDCVRGDCISAPRTEQPG